MAFVCQAPDCETEFDDAVVHDDLDAAERGETPFFSRTYVPDDGFGVGTDYVCSAECMRAYLDDLDTEGDA